MGQESHPRMSDVDGRTAVGPCRAIFLGAASMTRIGQRFRRYFGSTTKRKSSPPSKRRQRFFLEQLEGRDLPSVTFTPQFGTEAFLQDGGKRINSPPVYVVMWGKSWTIGSFGVPTPAALQILSAANNVLGSHYTDGLGEYGVTTNATFAGTVFDNFGNQDPPNGFSQKNITDEINNLVKAKRLPDPATTPNMVVDMVTPPGISLNVANAAGWNNTAVNSKNDIVYSFIWSGT